ncbi:CPBP family intramembrane glutamic endopeptidase [Undibacterium oligocarboniphilum]|uniref:CPBP family intramembrane metalloprotease n=1 Tax=Undibacterium oligocarboniphilum TaxID=666702 RepID=A0A850QJU3_9BURK|nr:CPBP family intramembrane glutamic endopeptidase [Undibacterium oligocarboniphilum]MBC3871751.1 CPBP family intramembrane metalloprotease [Undibacterium oligocarboniphilum]NVO79387.1 CPBP family intramembrane metalloprotease [Undibacterium oligocarboniphilum]
MLSTSFLLYLATLCVLVIKPAKHYWYIPLSAFLVAGIYEGFFTPTVLALIVVLTSLHFTALNGNQARYRRLSILLTCCIGLALSLHKIPFFHNPLIVEKAVLSTSAIPFTLYVNLDKGLAGLFMFATLIGLDQVRTPPPLNVNRISVIAVATILAVFGFALLSGMTRFDPHLSSYLWPFVMVNLFITCFTEEVFFRSGIQRFCHHRFAGNLIPVVITGIFFGLVHLGGGWPLMIAATVAGIGNGFVYATTKRVSLSIILHFLVNILHFTLFIYPAIDTHNALPI